MCIRDRAFAARLAKKVRTGGFNKRDVKTLVPPGIDPDSVKLKIDPDGKLTIVI